MTELVHSALGISCTCALHQQVDQLLNVRLATLVYRTKGNQIEVQFAFQESLNSQLRLLFFLFFSLPIIESLDITEHR